MPADTTGGAGQVVSIGQTRVLGWHLRHLAPHFGLSDRRGRMRQLGKGVIVHGLMRVVLLQESFDHLEIQHAGQDSLCVCLGKEH